MTFPLPDPLTAALRNSRTHRDKARRLAAAREAAELLRAGAPISDDARRTLAALLDGTLTPPRGRPVADIGRRLFAKYEYTELRQRFPDMEKDEALELIAKRYRVPAGTLAEWIYPHRKRKK